MSTQISRCGRLTRRSFLKTQATTGVSLAMFSTLSPLSRAYSADSPNEKFTIGFIGCGGMGHGDASEMAQFGNIVALADVNTDKTEWFRNESRIVAAPNECFTTQDYRKLLERNDIDVVGIATPDHWHVKIAVEALLAGKHVFCQKPLTLTIEENKLIRRAVKASGKIMQVGAQQRSDKDHFMLAALMVRKGMLGKIQRVVVNLPPGPVGGPFQTAPVPSNLDWNMFLGQAPYVEYIPQRAAGTFRYWYDYSGGVLTDWGAHHVDCALWALDQQGVGKGLVEIDGREVEHASPIDELGRPEKIDCFNTASTFNIRAKTANGIEFNVVSNKNENGILFEGTEGRIFVDRGRISGKPIEEGRHKSLTDDDFIAINKGKPVEWHKANFFRCIREGGAPAADVESHSYSMTACHLCAIAVRLRRTIQWDPKQETILGDELAASFMAREQRKGFELPSV